MTAHRTTGRPTRLDHRLFLRQPHKRSYSQNATLCERKSVSHAQETMAPSGVKLTSIVDDSYLTSSGES